MRAVLLGLTALGFAGCSIADVAGTGDSGNQPSANQVNAFAEQFATAFSNGLSSVTSSVVPRLSAVAATGTGAVTNEDGGFASVPINQQVTTRTNCTGGGRIEVNGSLTGNIDQNGSGVLLLQVLETITDWRCLPPFVINGDPYLSVAGSMPFLNGGMSSPATFSFGGGFKWGPPPGNGWQINMTATVNPDGSGRISGVIGPYSIDVVY